MPTPDNNGPDARAFRETAIALGGNMGDPPSKFLEVEAALAENPRFLLKAKSSLWLTEPVGGPPGQDPYHNMVMVLDTDLSPEDLMETLLALETRLGRVRRERWGPRVIDIDVLYVDDLLSSDPRLLLPHPRMAERAFALLPLAEVNPRYVHPGTKLSVSEMIARLDPDGPEVRRLEGPPNPAGAETARKKNRDGPDAGGRL
ncbi:MAG: 2-amino-4-hydroxy-6-hydroxymethyldihydropteridine diphosphokinase [Deltaproteobacteria bacterium]|jgi:2-amino-4-hydroxy-6-hydroxymethyldihydropteridine diphosphokinase|nr:2-amino-4-hydroxy-6-hydroxymethyldihydropteridine diphosphokinase [Deltaproteobacteria bacterium]